MHPPPLSSVLLDDTKVAFQDGGHELQSESSSVKPGGKTEVSLGVSRGVIRAPSPNPSLISVDETSNVRIGRDSQYLPVQIRYRHACSRSPAPPRTIWSRMQLFWVTNKGLGLVLIAQLFGTLMNVTIRLLEMEGNGGKGYHPFQILFARMSITVVCASLYMWYTKTEHFPWGLREVRPLLVARGLTGFFGVFGMYYSLLYLPLADATVITFLAPSLSCWICSFLIHEPFTRTEQIAAYISLFGVVLIARPISLFASFSHSGEPVSPSSGLAHVVPANASVTPLERLAADYDAVTPTQRATAVGIALLGMFGASGAFTTIRWIGKRAHPLISVNYFATWCTIVSIVAMFTIPSVGVLLPNSWKDWCYLVFLGVCGFAMQFLLAAGLQYEKSSRATNMTYMQMLFALSFDKIVWGTTPGALSIVGSSLILGSAIYVALHREDSKKTGQGEGEIETRKGH
ncbi:hypothetical protein GQ44DRAFT_831867 [Phaeosphaeriaceae sp. PMI808]|nr:hypothetical protein GQ44DRAFT_831867 [Phaeosphaeriaceae sp. PMI808]